MEGASDLLYVTKVIELNTRKYNHGRECRPKGHVH